MIFIRCLWGEIDKDKKLVQEIKKSFRNTKHGDFAKNGITYLTLGKINTRFLKWLGAKKVIEVDKSPLLRESGCINSWNRLLLYQYAAFELGPFVCTDFDAIIRCRFSVNRCVDLISRRNCNIQIPTIGYCNERFFWRRRGRKLHWNMVSRRKGFNGSFFYLARPEVANWLLEDFDELWEKIDITSIHPNQRCIGDEQCITYSLEKRLGKITLKRAWEEFEPDVIKLRRSPFPAFGKKKNKQEIMFSHK